MIKVELNQRKIFILWFPVAVTWILMSSEAPIIQGLVARLENPTINLAALGLAIAISHLCESPIFSIISGANTLVCDYKSYRLFRNFTLILSGFLSLIVLLIVSPPIFDLLAGQILNLPHDLALLVKDSLIFLIPAPFFVAYRRLYQGILIRNGRNAWLAVGTVSRLVSILLSMTLLVFLTSLSSAVAAGIAFCFGFAVEASIMRVIAHSSVCKLRQLAVTNAEVKAKNFLSVATFYLPLGFTSVLMTSLHFVLSFFLSRGRMPVESLAVYPVLMSLSWLFICSVMAMQEVIISRLDDSHRELPELGKFAFRLLCSIVVLEAIVFFSPLSTYLFTEVYSLDLQLAALAKQAVPWLLLLPVVSLITIWQRAVLIHSGNTLAVTKSSLVELITAALLMLILSSGSNFSGLINALLALIIGRSCGILSVRSRYLAVRARARDATVSVEMIDSSVIP